MAGETGVYVCTGCGIGSCLDKDRLMQIAVTEYHAPVVRSSPAFCLEDAQLIRDDIASKGVTSVVIAACSSRVNTDVFSFSPASVERVNIREQVAWTHSPNTPETQEMAEDQLRMGIAKAVRTQPSTPAAETNEGTVMVIGGGMAGLNAALAAARAGYPALLVERMAKLGGFGAKLFRQYPKRAPYLDLEETGLSRLIDLARAEPRIRLLTETEVVNVTGRPGRFNVVLRSGGTLVDETVGAIVVATGLNPYDPARLAHYGFGKYANVITNARLEELAGEPGGIHRPSDGRPLRSVAIVQCDSDEADADHLPYTGNVTSLASL
ncbi:MAG: FAD-dependent oxidoreductase, partial [Chloroflexota bacterium]